MYNSRNLITNIIKTNKTPTHDRDEITKVATQFYAELYDDSRPVTEVTVQGGEKL